MSSPKVVIAIVVCVVALAAISCDDDNAAPAPAPATPAVAPAGEEVNLRTVPSGDTLGVFLLGANVDKRDARVRVLGVTACDANSGQGFAAHEAARVIAGQHGGGTSRVRLTTQPGAFDTDSSGALLRYVRMGDGSDLGELLVADPHIGVATEGYASGASAAYLAKLRAADPNGRNCAPDTLSPADPNPAGESDGHTPVPMPNDGNDNDHHESRFCRKHWYC